jgi:hypothetical protein
VGGEVEATARPPRPRRSRAGLLVAIAATLAGVLIVDLVAAASAPAPTTSAPDRARTVARGAPGGVASVRGRAIAELLARRAAAIMGHDEAAYLATDDPADGSYREKDARVFADLQAVPFASFTFSFDPTSSIGLSPPALSRYGAPVYAPAAVYERYSLAGFDRAPTEVVKYDTFVERRGAWYLASEDDFAAAGFASAADLWDSGPVAVVRLADVLVLGHPSPLLAQLADETARDIPRVDAVWGDSWSRRAVVFVPATQREMGAIIDTTSDLDQIAAVATAELSNGQARSAVGDRIIVNPANFVRLDALGRQVVVTHELTHVASRAYTGPALPVWLVEGLADYVGYLDTGLPVRVAATELAAEVQGGHVPPALPANAAFAGNDPRLAQVYEEAWLACRLIVADFGQAALIRLYRTVGVAAASPGGNVSGPGSPLAAAMAGQLHLSLAAFTARWRSYLVSELS